MQGDAAPDLGKGRKRRCHLLNDTDRCADTNRVHCKPANLRPACSWLTHTIKQGDAEQTRAAVSINQRLPAQEQRASREARGRINRGSTKGGPCKHMWDIPSRDREDLEFTTADVGQQSTSYKAALVGYSSKTAFPKRLLKKKSPFILSWGWDTPQHHAQPKEVPAILRVCGQDGG